MLEPYAQKVREAFGRALLHSNMMLVLVDNSIKMCIEGDQVGALTEQERSALRRARADIKNARRRALAVARRCVNETE